MATSTLRSQGTLFPDLQPDARVISQERLPTNTTTRHHAIHRWFNFIAGFSPEFVHQCCDALGDSGEVLLDPFTGCATAPLVACERGLRAFGYEPHPVFIRIARAKLPRRSAITRLAKIQRLILSGLKEPISSTDLPESPQKFLGKLFPREILQALLGARQALADNSMLGDDLAFLVLSAVIERTTHSQTDGVYKAPTSAKKPTCPFEALDSVAAMIRSDLLKLGRQSFGSRAKIYAKSAENMSEIPDSTVSLVVTSPPYLNNFDFAEMTRMHLYFWGMAHSWGEITQRVRRRLIVNTTTALKGHKEHQQTYRAAIPAVVIPELDSVVSELAARKSERAGKKEYDYLVYPYFSQMTRILHECFRCIASRGPIHIMVADAALYGVHISTPQILSSILAEVGFKDVECSLVRSRGHRWILDKREGSTRGLGEYHIIAEKP